MNPVTEQRVLLVEDDEDLGAALCEYLEMAGFGTHWVRRALEFYRVIGVAPGFDVAIVDIGLPDQSGLVLAEYIRHNADTSVVVLTASDTVERSAESYRLGVDLFLAKPVDGDVLVAAVTSLAMRSRQRQGLADRVQSSVPVSEGSSGPDTSRARPPAPVWVIDRRRRQLLSPAGDVVDLTRQELTLCLMFAESPEHSVTRVAQLERLYGRDDESARRALDTTMSRLRRKISDATGETPPILTDYGVGHSFSQPLELLDTGQPLLGA